MASKNSNEPNQSCQATGNINQSSIAGAAGSTIQLGPLANATVSLAPDPPPANSALTPRAVNIDDWDHNTRLLRSPESPSYELPLPENVLCSGLSSDEISTLVDKLMHMPANVENTQCIGGVLLQMAPFLPHQGQRRQLTRAESQFLLDRELTAMLWEAYHCSLFIHINDFDFDRTHFFLMDLLADMFRCGDPRESNPTPCHAHEDSDDSEA